MTPLPGGFRLVLDRSVLRYRAGRVLVGGSPPRLMTLTRAGRAALEELTTGPASSARARSLGRRLVDGGLAHPRPPARHPAGVTVVVPVRDRSDDLRRCLSGVASTMPVVVVDDGSRDPASIARVCATHGARLLRHERAAGPAAARNTGLAAVESELVAFIDSDCIADPRWVQRLAGHFADPTVGAVAPRIRPRASPGAPTWMRRFDEARCALDMGPDESAVGPGRRVPYVPTAALVARRSALPRFDERLLHGEDVDLVWRLHDAGWRIRYDPSVVVEHREPATWTELLARRRRYGRSAAPLARRHPGRLAPAVVRPVPAIVLLMVLLRRPGGAACLMAGQAAWSHRRIGPAGIPARRTLAWSVESVAHADLALGRTATTLAAPVLAAALLRRETRAVAVSLLIGAPMYEWLRRRPALDPLRWTAACVSDDVAYGVGVWGGCLRERTIGPLVPRRTPPR